MTQHSTPGVAQVTYQAAWSPAENEVTVIQNVHGGVDGPHGDYPATSREEALQALRTAGYAPDGEWTVSRLGDHWINLVQAG